jgi:pyruvate oxidase
MAMAEMVTAVKYELPMVVVVLNNRQLAMIQVEQKAEGYPNFGTDLLNPDFAAYAKACGCVGMRVARPEEFPRAVTKALKEKTVVLIDVETDPKRF